jgi:hypothetical protein
VIQRRYYADVPVAVLTNAVESIVADLSDVADEIAIRSAVDPRVAERMMRLRLIVDETEALLIELLAYIPD